MPTAFSNRGPGGAVARREDPGFGRYSLVLVFAAVGLGAFTLLRAALLVRSWGEAQLLPGDLAFIFGAGLLYDLAFLAYASAGLAVILLMLPSKIFRSRPARGLAFGAALFLFSGLYFILAAEWLFWDEFSTRFNFIAVDYLVYRSEVTHNILESYPVAWIFAGIGAAALITVLALRPVFGRGRQTPERFGRRLAFAGALAAAAFAAYFGIGQDLRGRPANAYVGELASDGPYQFFAAFKNNSLDYRTLYAQGSDERLSPLLKAECEKTGGGGALYDIARAVAPAGGTRPANVVLVTVESLSAGFLASFGNREGLTPFLDGLAREGELFTNLYATGTRTDRGLEAVTLSIPPTPGRSVIKRPDFAHYYTLGKVFQDQGYDTAFLYGGRGYFDNMNAFFAGNGYRVIDQTDFSHGEVTFRNAWGVCDEDLYRKAVAEADRVHAQGRNFFFHIMTTSNHRPYTYPAGRIDIPSGTGRNGAVKYTDYALRTLMEAARKRPWFGDTVFVITADHCSGVAGKEGLPVARYHIPMLIYAPGRVAPGEVAILASQIDIAPTVLALLEIPYTSHFFGRDILAPGFDPRALIGNYQKLGLFEDDRLVILSPRKRIEIIEDPLGRDLQHEGSADDPEVQETMAYYQGADYILHHGLDHWEARPQ